MNMVTPPIGQAQKLAVDHFSFINGNALLNKLECDFSHIHAFTEEWDSLTLDKYMGDGGHYRYRRYGQFNKLPGKSQLNHLPHEPYVQSKEVNYLNGDLARHFDPLTESFVHSPVLKKLLNIMADVYDEAMGHPCHWNIRLHPYRIITTQEEAGKPTPEGLHRDGVTFIASMLIQRSNVWGGITTLTDNMQSPKAIIVLEKMFDLLMSDDEKTMHHVSPIHPINPDKEGIRDVLVIAFTKMEVEKI